MESPARLPVELYRPVIEHVKRRKDLYHLLLVSWDIWREAEQVLYREVALQGRRQKFHLQLFITIASCSRIAQHVHHIHIFTISRRSQAAPKVYWDAINSALRATHNLKNLYLLVPRDHSTYFSRSPFEGCTFRLRILTIHSSIYPTIALDSAFLASQTEIVKLDLRGFCHLPFPQTALLKLSILNASDMGTAQFINTPSLRSVYLLFGLLSVLSMGIHSFVSSISQWPILEHIESLRLRLSFPLMRSPEPFERLIQQFPSLLFLQIDNFSFEFRSLSRTNEELRSLFSMLKPLARLEKLCLCFSAPIHSDGRRRMSEDVFQYLGSLQVFTFEDPFTLPKGIGYEWIRGVEGFLHVKRREQEWQDDGWYWEKYRRSSLGMV